MIPNGDRYRGKVAPQHQVIQTTPASRFRKDFGLKNPMPRGWKSPHITVQSLDHNGMTKYEHGSSFHFKKRRFEEMGTALRSDTVYSFFEKPVTVKRWGDLKVSEANEMRENASSHRQEFLKFIQEKTKSLIIPGENNTTAHDMIQKFYGIHEKQGRIVRSNDVRGNAGMSYLLQGSMGNVQANSGTLHGRPVKGRATKLRPESFNSSTAAIGGFVATCHASTNSSTKYIVREAKLHEGGEVDLSVVLYGNKRTDAYSTSSAVYVPTKSTPLTTMKAL